MDRIMSRPIRVSASFQTFAVRMLLYSAEVTSKGIFLQGVKSGGTLSHRIHFYREYGP